MSEPQNCGLNTYQDHLLLNVVARWQHHTSYTRRRFNRCLQTIKWI